MWMREAGDFSNGKSVIPITLFPEIEQLWYVVWQIAFDTQLLKILCPASHCGISIHIAGVREEEQRKVCLEPQHNAIKLHLVLNLLSFCNQMEDIVEHEFHERKDQVHSSSNWFWRDMQMEHQAGPIKD